MRRWLQGRQGPAMMNLAKSRVRWGTSDHLSVAHPFCSSVRDRLPQLGVLCPGDVVATGAAAAHPEPASLVPHLLFTRATASCSHTQGHIIIWDTSALILYHFWPCPVTCGVLVPQTGIELASFALESPSLNHWTSREAPVLL